MPYFRWIIDKLGGPAKFAGKLRIPASHARAMKTRDSIAPAHWPRLIIVARAESISISEEQLLSLYQRRWPVAARRRAA